MEDTNQAFSLEELPGRLSEEDEGKHEEDPPNPIGYLRREGRWISNFVPSILYYQVGWKASVCVSQVERVRVISFLHTDLNNIA